MLQQSILVLGFNFPGKETNEINTYTFIFESFRIILILENLCKICTFERKQWVFTGIFVGHMNEKLF